MEEILVSFVPWAIFACVSNGVRVVLEERGWKISRMSFELALFLVLYQICFVDRPPYRTETLILVHCAGFVRYEAIFTTVFILLKLTTKLVEAFIKPRVPEKAS